MFHEPPQKENLSGGAVGGAWNCQEDEVNLWRCNLEMLPPP